MVLQAELPLSACATLANTGTCTGIEIMVAIWHFETAYGQIWPLFGPGNPA